MRILMGKCASIKDGKHLLTPANLDRIRVDRFPTSDLQLAMERTADLQLQLSIPNSPIHQRKLQGIRPLVLCVQDERFAFNRL